MKSQKLIARKRLKERNRRKDFLKKKNIRKNNWPTPRTEETISKVIPVKEDGRIKYNEGRALYKKTGEEKVMSKLGKDILIAGEGVLPKNRKVKEKKTKK